MGSIVENGLFTMTTGIKKKRAPLKMGMHMTSGFFIMKKAKKLKKGILVKALKAVSG